MTEDWGAKIKLLNYYKEITMDKFDQLEEAICNDMEPDNALLILAEIRYRQHKLETYIEKITDHPSVYESEIAREGKKLLQG